MSRYKYYGFTRDGHGHIINNATVSVYLSGGNTAASVYGNNTGGTAVNSVESANNGMFTFFVDDSVYASNQTFKVVVTKTGYTASTIDEISIFPGSLTSLISTPTDPYSDGYPRLVCYNAMCYEIAPSGGSYNVRVYADHCIASVYGGTSPYTYYMAKSGGAYGTGNTTASNVYLEYNNTDLGATTLNVKVTDSSNNSAICQIAISIQDNQAFAP